MWPNWRLRDLGSVVFQTKVGTELLLNYFVQEQIPEKSIQEIEVIRDKLDQIRKDLVEKANQSLDEKTVEAYYHKQLAQWSQCIKDLLILTDKIIQIEYLNYRHEIQKEVHLIKWFLRENIT